MRWLATGVAMLVVTWLALGAVPARAGDWMQVSCVNPDGSAAASEGWTSFTTGAVNDGSNNNTNCGPGRPMGLLLSALTPAPVGASENLRYTAPAGSTLIGGSMDISLSADGGGASASGVAAVYEPAYAYDGSDVLFQCANGLAPCSGGTNDFSGTLALPTQRGGSLFLEAGCGGASGQSCNSGGKNGAWSSASVRSARLLLSNSASPTGAGFSGTALQPGVSGVGHLLFTAGDAGAGVYRVNTFVGRQLTGSIVPNSNGGQCAPVGTDPGTGALIFDSSQPCPTTTAVDVPVATAGLSDGRHELVVAVTDAAQNTAVVFDQRITTSNPQHTPKPRSRHSVRAQFVISWSWTGSTTRLRSISVHNLPRRATVRITCSGRRCPRLAATAARGSVVRRRLRALSGASFRAGDHVVISVTAPRRRRERIELLIRNNRQPRARLLRP